MFGLSWGQISIIVLVGVFVLGPERIPTAVRWVTDSLRKVRTMAAGAQAQLNREIGPELDELRRQIADLQSLKEIQDLRDLRDLHPKRLIGNTILGEEFTGGGIGGFLGMTGPPTAKGAAAPTAAAPTVATSTASAPAAGSVKPVSATPPSAPVPAPTQVPAPPTTAPAARPGPPATAPAAARRPTTAHRPGSPSIGSAGPPSGRLAAPKVVGAPRRVAPPPPPPTPVAGFDADAT